MDYTMITILFLSVIILLCYFWATVNTEKEMKKFQIATFLFIACCASFTLALVII